MSAYDSFDLFIIRSQNNLTKDDWNVISEKYKLSNDMMRLFQNQLNWRKIAQFQELSISFIREFINYQLNDYIHIICQYQELDENFIHEFANILDWELILEHQDISTNFIINHAENIQNAKDNLGYDEVYK